MALGRAVSALLILWSGSNVLVSRTGQPGCWPPSSDSGQTEDAESHGT